MGIQINGQTDNISATDGSLTISGAELPTVTNLNATGIVTATGFVGNVTGNLNSSGVSTTTTLNTTNIKHPSFGSNTFVLDSSGNINIDSGGVYYDATNNRLAIGTTSPGTTLHLSASSPRFRLEDSDGGYAHIEADGGNLFLVSDNGASQANSFLALGVDGSEKARIDSSGRLLVGTSTSIGSQNIQVGSSAGTLGLYKFANNDDGGEIDLVTSRNATIGSHTVVQNNDWLGRIFFRGSDGSAFLRGAEIACQVDGTPGTDDMPGRLVFFTTAAGASSPTERLRISSDGSMSAVIPGGSTLYPAFTCRAWVNFDGTGTPAIRASGNVSSITDNGTGNYTVNFTTALADADYAMVASGSDGGSGPTTYVQEGTRLTTSCPVLCLQRDGNVRDDADFQCAFFR
jgi:hypothetical protein